MSADKNADVDGAVTLQQPPSKALGEGPAAAVSPTLTIFITALVSLSLPNSSLDTDQFRVGVGRGTSRLSAQLPIHRHLLPSGPLGGPLLQGRRQPRKLWVKRTAGLLRVHMIEHLLVCSGRRLGLGGRR